MTVTNEHNIQNGKLLVGVRSHLCENSPPELLFKERKEGGCVFGRSVIVKVTSCIHYTMLKNTP